MNYLTYIHEMYLQVDECTGSLLVRSLSSLASFPGLPRFFCSSVDNNTWMRKGGENYVNNVFS